MATNVDAIYAPDLSTRSALPLFLGRLAAGVTFRVEWLAAASRIMATIRSPGGTASVYP
jgi:hypothetical protein